MKWLGRREMDIAAADRAAMRKPVRAAGMQILLATLAARHAVEFGPVLAPPMIEAAAQVLWTSPHVREIYQSVEVLREDLDDTLMAPGGTEWRAHVVRVGADEAIDGDALLRSAFEARKKVLVGDRPVRIRGRRFDQ